MLVDDMSGSERSGTVGGCRARVLAVDDQPPFLAILRAVVGATGNLEIAGEARSGEEAIVAAHELRPEMVLMDVRMPGIGGLKAAERIKANQPPTLVVLISSTHPDELSRESASCFTVIWKSVLGPRLLDEIWTQHRGGTVAGPVPRGGLDAVVRGDEVERGPRPAK
jgi:DNA-binding NarL/FixJ family response regulator